MNFIKKFKVLSLKFCPAMILRDIIYLDPDIKFEAGKELLKRNLRNRYFLIGNLVTIIEMIPALRRKAAEKLLSLNPSRADLYLIIELVPYYRIEAGKQLIALNDINLMDVQKVKEKIPYLWNSIKDSIIIDEKKVS